MKISVSRGVSRNALTEFLFVADIQAIQMSNVSWWLIKLLIRLQFPTVKQLSTTDLAGWLADEKTQPLLLDARTLEEYRVSHLCNAVLVPQNLLDFTKEVEHSTPIVVYCSVGYRSSAIASRLNTLGYDRVFNLSGSIFQWVNENRSVYRDGELVNTVHPYQKFWQHLLNSGVQLD